MVFPLPRQIVQVLVRQFLGANAGPMHGYEGVGDGLRMGLEGAMIPTWTRVLRAAEAGSPASEAERVAPVVLS